MRELENVIERAVVLCGDREIGPDLIPDHVSADHATRDVPDVVIPPEGIHFREVIIGHERRYIEAALEAAGGVQKKAAELLHIKPTTLNEMIKRYDIRPRRRKGVGDARDAGDRRPGPDGEPAVTAGCRCLVSGGPVAMMRPLARAGVRVDARARDRAAGSFRFPSLRHRRRLGLGHLWTGLACRCPRPARTSVRTSPAPCSSDSGA